MYRRKSILIISFSRNMSAHEQVKLCINPIATVGTKLVYIFVYAQEHGYNSNGYNRVLDKTVLDIASA